MTAPSQAESLKWAVCPIKFEDLRSPRYFSIRKKGALPVISVVDYPGGTSPRFHLNASTFPLTAAVAPGFVLAENPPEWVKTKFRGHALVHKTITHDEVQSLSIGEIENRFAVPSIDLQSGEAIEYGGDLDAELSLLLSSPDCCLSIDSRSDEVEAIALQLPGNDFTRERASIREYLILALWAYDDAVFRIWPSLSAGAFAKWIRSYQFHRYLHRSSDRLTRASVIRELVRTTAGIKPAIERVRCSLQMEVARYAVALEPGEVRPSLNSSKGARRGRKPNLERNAQIASILNSGPWKSDIKATLRALDAALPKISAPLKPKPTRIMDDREPYASWEDYGRETGDIDVKKALQYYQRKPATSAGF